MKIDGVILFIYAFLVLFIVISLVAGNVETERWCMRSGMGVKYENFIAACVTTKAPDGK